MPLHDLARSDAVVHEGTTVTYRPVPALILLRAKRVFLLNPKADFFRGSTINTPVLKRAAPENGRVYVVLY